MECKDLNSSLETLILFENKCKKRKHKHKNSTRNKKVLTQKIKVQREMFTCVINLNTSISEHKTVNIQTECDKKPTARIVPHCFRKCCSNSRVYKDRNRHHLHDNKYSRKARGMSARYYDRPHYSRTLLLPESEISYDEISNTSFSPERPLSYKHFNYTDEPYYSKLDTLIRRAKERERQMVAESRKKLLWSSTRVSDISSDESMSCHDASSSIHSRSTLLLNLGDNRYIKSPIKTKFNYSPSLPNNIKYNYSRSPNNTKCNYSSPPNKNECNYSPISSNFLEEILRKLPDLDDCKPNIKTEVMEAGAYSPIAGKSIVKNEPDYDYWTFLETDYYYKTSNYIKKEVTD